MFESPCYFPFLLRNVTKVENKGEFDPKLNVNTFYKVPVIFRFCPKSPCYFPFCYKKPNKNNDLQSP